MKIIDNINTLLGDDLKRTLRRKDRLKIAASCFSLYAYEALCKELKQLEAVEFLFTEPAFLPFHFEDCETLLLLQAQRLITSRIVHTFCEPA